METIGNHVLRFLQEECMEGTSDEVCVIQGTDSTSGGTTTVLADAEYIDVNHD